ncbi:MAG: adenosylcobinamide-GDP ribazoletransferase [Lachnospiraceae bacterium]
MLIVFFYYRYKSYKEFGGITGDLAGWFLCLCEMAGTLICAIMQ